MEHNSEKSNLLMNSEKRIVERNTDAHLEEAKNVNKHRTNAAALVQSYGSVTQYERKSGLSTMSNMQQDFRSKSLDIEKNLDLTTKQNNKKSSVENVEHVCLTSNQNDDTGDVSTFSDRRKRFLFVAMATMDFFGGMLFGMIAPFYPTVVSKIKKHTPRISVNALCPRTNRYRNLPGKRPPLG